MANIMYDNCFISSYKTVVEEVVEENGYYWHALDETIFYVEGGGMSSDEGLINQHPVLKVKKERGKIWHLLRVKLEGKVTLSIDFHLRFARCQIHTAQHLISGVMQNVYNCNTLSHHIHDQDNDIVFDIDEINERQLHELQVIVNGMIRDDLLVSIFYPTKKEAERYHVKNAALLDEIRMVKIGDISIEPCGCMHVPSLRYLQMIKITGAEKTSKGISIHYICGDQLLNNYEKYQVELSKASKLLAQPYEFIEVGILKQMQEIRNLQADLLVVKEKYIDALIASFNGNEKRFKVFDDIDLRTYLMLCAKYKEKYNELFIFVWKQNARTHVFVGNDTNSDVIFKQIAEAFGLNGGGNAQYAQGGGSYKEGLESYISKIIEEM